MLHFHIIEFFSKNQSRRKRRPPNVLSFHPDNTYASEYYVR